jgi:hypothetical protein
MGKFPDSQAAEAYDLIADEILREHSTCIS